MKSKTLISLSIATSLVLAANTAKAQWQSVAPNHVSNNNLGNVGIKSGGTAFVPSALFQVQGGSVLFDGTTGTTPVSGAGTRMMWIPSKSAFRAGFVTQTTFGGLYPWDDSNIGIGSAAFGQNAMASGANSFACGGSSIASSYGSFACGNVTTASGGYSSAFGLVTTAQSYASFVIGQRNYNPGTYSPDTWIATEPLFVIGNGANAKLPPSNAMTVLKNGNVGIGLGTRMPVAKIDVYEPSTTTPLNTALKIGAYMNNVGTGTFMDFNLNWTGTYPNWIGGRIGSIYETNSPGNNRAALVFYTNDDNNATLGAAGTSEKMRIQGNGNVLINKISQVNSIYKLDVNGSVRANEVVVNTTGADFVFEDEYKLTSLATLEQSVKQNKHLPGIASAYEMQTNGVNIGEFNTTLLQKVEELTLYIIDQNKRIEALEKTITK